MRVRELSGEWRILPQSQVLALARADCLYGKGSPSKLRYCVAQVPSERLEEVIQDAADKLHAGDASQTTVIERRATERDGRTFRSTLYQHHPRCFEWGIGQ